MTPDHDKQLLAEYLSGKSYAQEKVDSWIVSMARSRAWGPGLPVSDIIQECRLRVHQSLSKGGFAGRAPLRSYVFSVVSNISMTWMRKKYRKPPMLPLDSVPDLSDPADDPLGDLIRTETEEIRTRVVNAIMSLATPGCRDVWRLIYYEKLKYEDVAEMLGIEVGTVKSRVSRCKDKARTAFRVVARELGLETKETLEL